MKRSELEKIVKNEYEGITPNKFSKIQKRIKNKNDSVISNNADSTLSFQKKFSNRNIALIVCFSLIAIFLILFPIFYLKENNSCSYIELSINPKVAIVTNHKGVIQQVNPLNEEGAVLLEYINYKNLNKEKYSVEEILNLLIKSAKDLNYIKEDNPVEITTYNTSSFALKKLNNGIKEMIDKKNSFYNKKVKIITGDYKKLLKDKTYNLENLKQYSKDNDYFENSNFIEIQKLAHDRLIKESVIDFGADFKDEQIGNLIEIFDFVYNTGYKKLLFYTTDREELFEKYKKQILDYVINQKLSNKSDEEIKKDINNIWQGTIFNVIKKEKRYTVYKILESNVENIIKNLEINSFREFKLNIINENFKNAYLELNNPKDVALWYFKRIKNNHSDNKYNIFIETKEYQLAFELSNKTNITKEESKNLKEVMVKIKLDKIKNK